MLKIGVALGRLNPAFHLEVAPRSGASRLRIRVAPGAPSVSHGDGGLAIRRG